MKKNIKTLAALLIASATFVACSSDNDIISENQQPVNPTGKYTMTINASKGDGATTRALSLDGKTLNATWATTENVYVQKGSEWATGSLKPQENGVSTTLKGELSGITINANDELTLQFPKSGAISYAGQLGTLADIAANFDYATATVEVESVSATGNITPKAATTTFTNLQAIVKFTLLDKGNSDAAISATQLVVNDGTNDYTINPASGTSEIYVAIPGISGQTVTLTATVGDDTYTYEKSGVTFTNGQYYEITVKMTKQAAAATGHALSTSVVGEIVCSDGLAYAAADKDNLPSGVTAVAMVAYKGASAGSSLAIALTDEGSMDWSTAKSTCEGKDPIGGNSWRLPSINDWQYMFIGCGGSYNEEDEEWSYGELMDKLTAAGGTALKTDYYWSSTEAWSGAAEVSHFYGSIAWLNEQYMENYATWVRACLAF